MKSLTLKEIKKLRQGQLAKECLELLRDFPILSEAGVIDAEGKATSVYPSDLLLVLFRVKDVQLSHILGQSRNAVSSSLGSAFINPDETPALHHLVANCAFAEALMQRADHRGSKPHIWAQHAELLAAHLDSATNAQPLVRKQCFHIAERWYDVTIQMQADGLNMAYYGLGRLYFNHAPSDMHDAQEKAVGMFISGAKLGHLPSIDALIQLGTGNALEAPALSAAVEAIEQGAKANPADAASYPDKLRELGLLPLTPGATTEVCLPQPPAAKL